MSNFISASDILTITVLKIELQRITDMNLKINSDIVDYMQSRIMAIETAPLETERLLLT